MQGFEDIENKLINESSWMRLSTGKRQIKSSRVSFSPSSIQSIHFLNAPGIQFISHFLWLVSPKNTASSFPRSWGKLDRLPPVSKKIEKVKDFFIDYLANLDIRYLIFEYFFRKPDSAMHACMPGLWSTCNFCLHSTSSSAPMSVWPDLALLSAVWNWCEDKQRWLLGQILLFCLWNWCEGKQKY